MTEAKRPRELRKKETWAEKLMWRWLRSRRFNDYKFNPAPEVDLHKATKRTKPERVGQ